MFSKALKILVFGIACGWSASSCATGNEGVNREYQLKTAYLLHFAELTEWPESTSITICLQGHGPIETYLPALNGVKAHDQTIQVLLGDHPLIQQCQILFLSEADTLSKSLLTEAKSHHVLLVSDTDDFARNGGMIQFTLRDNKLKLVVNLTSVKEAGLKLSSKLLRMAEILE
ncbi:YfiR family protein [Methylomonas sp. MgM2]